MRIEKKDWLVWLFQKKLFYLKHFIWGNNDYLRLMTLSSTLQKRCCSSRWWSSPMSRCTTWTPTPRAAIWQLNVLKGEEIGKSEKQIEGSVSLTKKCWAGASKRLIFMWLSCQLTNRRSPVTAAESVAAPSLNSTGCYMENFGDQSTNTRWHVHWLNLSLVH